MEGGVPIEAATVMVLLFALTRAQQPQLAEALFCTAFGMFANMQPLLSAPWPTATGSPATSHTHTGDPVSCAAFSSGSRSPISCAHAPGSATRQDEPVQTLFTSPGADQCGLHDLVTAQNLGEGHAMSSAASIPTSMAVASMPASGANSACLSASATPSATPAAQGMPFAPSGAPPRHQWSKASVEPPVSDDSPQALLARVLDLYKLVESQANSKFAGAHPYHISSAS